MPAFEGDPFRSESVERFGGAAGVLYRPYRHVGEVFRFGGVRACDPRAFPERLEERFPPFGVEQGGSAAGGEDWIDDQVRGVSTLEGVGGGADDGRVGEHACFDGVRRVVVEDGFDLRLNDVGRQGVRSLDAVGVLGGDGGDGCASVRSVCGDGFQVVLDAGSAAGVGACDGEDGVHGFGAF